VRGVSRVGGESGQSVQATRSGTTAHHAIGREEQAIASASGIGNK